MRKMYKKVYCCKLCKMKEFEEVGNFSYKEINMKLLNSEQWCKNSVHFCNEYDMGILEFIGVEKVVEK